MNYKISILTVTIFLTILGSNITFTQEKHDCGSKCKQLCFEDLTEEQENQLKDLQFKYEKEILPLKGDIDVKSAEMKKLLVAEDPNEKAIEQKIEEIGKLRIKMQKLRIHKQLKVRALLTPEQRVEFDQLVFMKSKHHKDSPRKGYGEKKFRLRKFKERGKPKTDFRKEIPELEEPEE